MQKDYDDAIYTLIKVLEQCEATPFEIQCITDMVPTLIEQHRRAMSSYLNNFRKQLEEIKTKYEAQDL